ncbi:hypothetical protein [Brachybacterium phenoliresistens]|uniref:hypothetical protein n=1 Tax=Brachybacterium phenoliresistens TaxID=396014 RepID=UPI0031D89121
MTVLGVWMLVGGVSVGAIVIERDLFFGGVTLAAGALNLLAAVMITVREVTRRRQ